MVISQAYVHLRPITSGRCLHQSLVQDHNVPYSSANIVTFRCIRLLQRIQLHNSISIKSRALCCKYTMRIQSLSLTPLIFCRTEHMRTTTELSISPYSLRNCTHGCDNRSTSSTIRRYDPLYRMYNWPGAFLRPMTVNTEAERRIRLCPHHWLQLSSKMTIRWKWCGS